MAAAVLIPMSTISLNGGVLPPSAVSQNAPRHGRNRAASMAKEKRGAWNRRRSVVEERDAVIAKALALVLRRSRNNSQESEEDGSDDGRVAAEEGWLDLDDVLAHPKLSSLDITLADVQRVVATPSSSTRLALRLSGTKEDPEDAASYKIRRVPAPTQAHKEALQASSSTWITLSADMDDLPEFIVYETTYPKYHLMLTSGSIKRAGGQPHLSFTPMTEEGAASDADVSIWVNLEAAMEQKVTWKRTESGNIITADEIPKSLWNKAVARRGDLGVLFEDGEIRKEIPVGLRGKGAKAKKGKGVLKSRADDDSTSE